MMLVFKYDCASKSIYVGARTQERGLRSELEHATKCSEKLVNKRRQGFLKNEKHMFGVQAYTRGLKIY